MLLIVCAVLGSVASPCRSSESPSETVFVAGTTVIDVSTGATQALDILIQDGRILNLSPPGVRSAPAGARLIDGAGTYAIPGLWDMHVHLTAAPELDDRIFDLFIVNGVTSVRDTGGLVDQVLAARERANSKSVAAPRVWVAGPVIDGSPPVHIGRAPDVIDTSVVANTREEAFALVDSFAKRGVDFIKPYEMLRPEVFSALVERAHYHHLPVTGHIPLRMTTVQALDAGLDGIEHLRGMEFDCARDPQSLLAERVRIMEEHAAEEGVKLRRRVHAAVRPGAFAAQDPSRCAALIGLFAEKGTWHTPTLHIVAFRSLRYYAEPRWLDTFRYLPESLQTTWRERLADYTDSSKYTEWETHGDWAIKTVGRMHEAGVRFLAGTDSPGLVFTPGFTLHDELAALVRAGLPPRAALQAATVNPAQFFNVERELGSIEQGKLADIVLLGGNPLADIDNTRRIVVVISKGRVYDRATLDAMLAAFDGLHRVRSEAPSGGAETLPGVARRDVAASHVIR